MTPLQSDFSRAVTIPCESFFCHCMSAVVLETISSVLFNLHQFGSTNAACKVKSIAVFIFMRITSNLLNK